MHDALVDTLTGDVDPGELKIDNPPAPILMVGLQGSGKTTTTAKLAKRLKEREGKRVLMASLDVNRPAAMEQLEISGHVRSASIPCPSSRAKTRLPSPNVPKRRPHLVAMMFTCSTLPVACTSMQN